MSDDNSKPSRTWCEIAEEASREQDSDRLQKLTEELERALDERRRKLHPESKVDDEEQPKKLGTPS